MKKLILGNKFGRLTIIEIIGTWQKRQVRVRCDCGNEKVMWWPNVCAGYSQSCGCYQAEQASKANITHGMTSKPARNPNGGYPSIFNSWVGLRGRCTNPTNPAYKNYGGRGITVCARWMESFDNFFEDMGATWFIGATIERKNVNGNYEPENCCWIPKSHQSLNTRVTARAAERHARIVELRAQGLNSHQIAEQIGMSASGVRRHFGIK